MDQLYRVAGLHQHPDKLRKRPGDAVDLREVGLGDDRDPHLLASPDSDRIGPGSRTLRNRGFSEQRNHRMRDAPRPSQRALIRETLGSLPIMMVF